MILRNGAHPKGIDLGPVSLMFPVSDMSYIGGKGTHRGESYRDISERLANVTRRVKAEAKPKPEPVVMHIKCPQCPAVFTTTNLKRVYCSLRCVDRRWKAVHRRPSRARAERVTVLATCHPERKYLAKGMCRNCYMVAWRAGRAA